jgi:hypothetical protein
MPAKKLPEARGYKFTDNGMLKMKPMIENWQHMWATNDQSLAFHQFSSGFPMIQTRDLLAILAQKVAEIEMVMFDGSEFNIVVADLPYHEAVGLLNHLLEGDPIPVFKLNSRDIAEEGDESDA